MTKKGDKIENIKTVIRRHLQKADVYAPELSYQIELAASDILLYRKLREKALSEVRLSRSRNIRGKASRGKRSIRFLPR